MYRTGNELTPYSKYDFKFKDYAPWVFRELRDLFRIDPAEYLVSMIFTDFDFIILQDFFDQ
jgi:hypothetical protein